MQMTCKQRRALALITLVLLLIAAARIGRMGIGERDIHVDEVWSVWQLIGPVTDYTRDETWPPLYSLLLDGWWRLVGIHMVPLRLFGVLVMLVGSAALYRAVRLIAGEDAALIAPLALAALALSGFITTQVRPYALVYGLFPVTFWLMLRYFRYPTWRRGVLLGGSMAAMFYTAYGSIGAFLMLGLYSAIVYRGRIWRWWLPGIVAVIIAFPAIRSVAEFALNRTTILSRIAQAPLPEALVTFYETYAGHNSGAWLVLFVAASVGILIGARHRAALALLVWAGGAVLIYALERWLGMFSPVYSWFIALGIAVWVAWGLTRLPRVGLLAGIAVLLAVLATPIPYERFQATPQPLGKSFEFLRSAMQWGDVLTIDPHWQDRYCACIEPEMFEYYLMLHFPNGLKIVDEPGDYRRVWYLKWDSQHDPAFEARVQQARIASVFVGPPEALFRLYEGPPNRAGVRFENALRFHGAELVDRPPGLTVRRAGDRIRMKLWWSVDEPLATDYSIGVQVHKDDRIVAQSDSAPQLVDATLPKATSQWVVGQYYVEERELPVPRDLAQGQLNAKLPVYLTVYQWWDGVRLDAPGTTLDKLLPIDSLYIKAWG